MDRKRQDRQTFTLSISHPSSDFSGCNTNHAQTLCLSVCANLCLCLSENHAILEFPKFRCSMCFFSFSCPSIRNDQEVSRQLLNWRGECPHLRPPLRFFGPSLGIGRALTIFDGGGAVSLSICFSIFVRSSSPYAPSAVNTPLGID
jgi:hypothetical protein